MANEKVLLVDDEEDFVEVLSQRLANRGRLAEGVTRALDVLSDNDAGNGISARFRGFLHVNAK